MQQAAPLSAVVSNGIGTKNKRREERDAIKLAVSAAIYRARRSRLLSLISSRIHYKNIRRLASLMEEHLRGAAALTVDGISRKI